MVLAAILAALALRRLPHANLSLLFLLAVVWTAVRWGLWPSVFASIVSLLAMNFIFTPPFFTLAVEEQGDLATLVFFILVAVLTGNLAARTRTVMASNKAALDRVSTLLDFSRRMAAAKDTDQALEDLVRRLSQLVRARVVALLPDEHDRLVVRASTPQRDEKAQAMLIEIETAWIETRAPRSGFGWSYFPLATSASRIGWVAQASTEISDEQRMLAHGLCEQASATIARILLDENLKRAQLDTETEQMRSALLSSVSHDLRTPLASIIGSTTSLLEYADKLDDQDRRELLQTAADEAQRLDRYVQNLLDMTRFGLRNVEPQREWIDLNDAISSAVSRLQAVLGARCVTTDVADEVSLLYVHGALIEQALVNLLDNAAAFSPADGTITLRARADGDAILVEVCDQGPGIAVEERERVFEMFYRAGDIDRLRRPGAGLGLAISKSIVLAHGGTICAAQGDGGVGACIRIILPFDSNPTGGTGA